MDLLREIRAFWNDTDGHRMSYYTRGNMVKSIAFVALTIFYAIFYLITLAFLIGTFPIWIIPYMLLYKSKK